MSPRGMLLIAGSTGLALLFALQVNALDAVKLGGELFIAGKTPLDPPTGEPKNTHAYVTISGPAAVQMYRNMRAKAQKDVCREGNMLKQAGPLMCSLTGNGRNAYCDFSVDLVKGALADGKPC